MDENGLPSRINFNAIFGSPNQPIAPGLLPNPSMAMKVQAAIDSWISDTCNTPQYPKLSRKTVSKETEELAREVIYKNPDLPSISDEEITQVTVEKIQHYTGQQILGGCELRQRWYPAQLLPRTYFAQGGQAFHESKLIAKMMTDLTDRLLCTNRRSRVNPTRIRLRESHHAFIYDLTTFTSNLHEQRYFVDRLAEYCTGHQVTVMDASCGLMPMDLGDLIRQYNNTNIQSTYSMKRVYKTLDVECRHHTAGFLGVYGNIANATFLHGVVMLQLCDNEDELNVAGDDGIKSSDDDTEAFDLLRFLGVLEMTKTFSTHEEGSIHLKRPIHQKGTRLYQGFLVIWPSFEYMVKESDDVDPRYPLVSQMTKRERRDALANSITGFLTSLSTTHLDEWMVDVVHSTLNWLYTVLSLPFDGHVPQIHGNTFGFVPSYDIRFVGLEPKANTIKRSYQGLARIPYRESIRNREDGTSLFESGSFMANSSKRLNYLEDMGYLEKKPTQTIVYGESGLNQLLKEYFDPGLAVYEYEVVGTIPEWFKI